MLPIDEIVCPDETLSSLCSLIDGTDLVDSLSNEIFTLFAPNNDALDGVDLSDEETVSQHLRYHTAYNQVIVYEDLFCDSEIYMTGNKATTKTECDGSDKFQVGGGNAQDSRPKIVDKRENACNGVVHIIDNVMLPGEDQGDEECQTICTFLLMDIYLLQTMLWQYFIHDETQFSNKLLLIFFQPILFANLMSFRYFVVFFKLSD